MLRLKGSCYAPDSDVLDSLNPDACSKIKVFFQNMYLYFKSSKSWLRFYISRKLHSKKAINANKDLRLLCFKMLQKEIELSLLLLLIRFCPENNSGIYKQEHIFSGDICQLRFFRPKICQGTLNWQKMDEILSCFKPTTIRCVLEKRMLFFSLNKSKIKYNLFLRVNKIITIKL